LVFGLAAAAQAAWAKSGACQRYRAELAALDHGGGNARAATRLAREVARLTAYAQAIGCGRGYSLFGGPPRECGAIVQHIRMMQERHARFVAQGGGGGSARQQWLRAAVQEACDPERDATAAVTDARGGGRLVCVRACDGFFFPLHNLPRRGRSGPDAMCQALCPAAQTVAYRIPGGLDGDIADAVSMRGKPYARLANAFRYQKAVDQSCSCRQPDQSWTEALNKAERMLERGRGDIIVTAKKAEELSRPKLARKAADKRLQQARTAVPVDVETTGSIAPAQAVVDSKTAAAAHAVQGSAGPAPALPKAETIAPVTMGDAGSRGPQGDAVLASIGVVAPGPVTPVQPTAP
jgi:hypothetical protein